MATYTKLSRQDINEFLNNYNLGDCSEFSALEEGATNSNYLITVQSKRYVLTIFEELKQLSFLKLIYKSLKQSYVPCAELIKCHQQDLMLKDKPALLFSWIDGASVLQPNSKHCQIMGHYLARLHKVNISFPEQLPETKNLLWSLKKAENLLNTDISDEDAEIIVEELSYFRQHSRLRLPTGLIHADCFRDNVLFNDVVDEPLLTAIIDFENATRGAFVFDLAVVINDWCSQTDGSLDRLKMRDLMMAYSKERALESIENQSIPLMLRAAAFRFWISRLSDNDKKPMLHGSSECLFCQEQKKDPEEFKRILLKRRLNLSGMQNH